MYYTGQILATGIGIIVGLEYNSWGVGLAIMFTLQVLVDIRHKGMK